MVDPRMPRPRCASVRPLLTWLLLSACFLPASVSPCRARDASGVAPARANAVTNGPVLDPAGLPVCTAAGDQLAPRVVPAADGGAIVVWADRRRGASLTDVYALGVASDGSVLPNWPDDGQLLSGSGNAGQPYPVPDGEGGALVLWLGVSSGYTGLHVQRVNADGTLAAGWPADGVRVMTPPSSEPPWPTWAGLLDAFPDGEGGAYAAILEWYGLGIASRALIARITADGTIAAGWPPTGLALPSNSFYEDHYHSAQFSADSGPGVLLLAGRSRRPPPERFYFVDFYRLSPVGAVLWVTTPPYHSDYGEGIRAAGMASDGAGGAFASWVDTYDWPTFGEDHYAQHYSATGAPLWSPTPPSPTCQYVEADGAGGAYLFGSRYRSQSLEVHRRRADGSLPEGWSASGIPIALPAAMGGVARATPEGELLLCWAEKRAGASFDIRAIGIDSSGTVAWGWDSGGTVVCAADSDQVAPYLARMSPGRYLACWQDRRTGNWDIRATRIDLPVIPVAVGPAPLPVRTASLQTPWPNPARGRATLSFAAPGPGDATVEVVDLGGRVRARLGTWAGRTASRTVAVDTERLEPGVYWVRLTQSGRSLARRFAVVR